MGRVCQTSKDAAELIQLGQMINEAIKVVVDEWSQDQKPIDGDYGIDDAKALPSHRLYKAQRTIHAISGAINERIAEPLNRLHELSGQFWESRALTVAIERRIADLCHEAGVDGVDINTLAEKTRVEPHKLSRIMRCLCANHIFCQTGDDRFANNRISAALVHNEEFRAYMMIYGMQLYSASDRFPKYLLGPKGASYNVAETCFQEAMGSEKPHWEWLSQRVKPDEISNDGPGYPGVADPQSWSHLKADADGLITRPELEIFSLGMVGAGKVNSSALRFDYPWNELLAGATIVDVGGGVGGFVLELLSMFPHFNCVVQDLPEVIDNAEKTFWPQRGPELLKSGHVSLMKHDFFHPNPIKEADVYWLRGVLHNWPDDYFIKILVALKEAMSDSSRILICDQVMNTTNGCDEMENAPAPLLANYGYYSRSHHQRDLTMMGALNGIERTPTQLKALVEKAGLCLTKIYETRCVFSVVQVQK